MTRMRKTQKPPEWVARFLAALADGTPAREAAVASGTTFVNAGRRRLRHPDFARAWTEGEMAGEARAPAAVPAAAPADAPAGAASPAARRALATIAPDTVRGANRLDRFIDELAASSNVSAAAAQAGIAVSGVYKLRRDSPEFARRWYAALAEGYDNLEMELLGRLRAGDDAERERGKFDTAAALRCLAAHRESVAREKGRRTLAGEVATIASINAKIDSLRLATEAGEAAIAQARRENAARRRAEPEAPADETD